MLAQKNTLQPSAGCQLRQPSVLASKFKVLDLELHYSMVLLLSTGCSLCSVPCKALSPNGEATGCDTRCYKASMASRPSICSPREVSPAPNGKM